MNYMDAQELACAILGVNYYVIVYEGREDEIEEAIYVKFGIDMEQFTNIVEALLPFTPVVQAIFTGIKYHAFIDEKEGLMIVKQNVEEEDKK